MTVRDQLTTCICVIAFALPLTAQNRSSAQNSQKDIDPLALRVLQAATDQIKDAKSYSFRALVSRDYLGTDDQIITLFSGGEFTVEKPNKLHVNFRGAGQPVEMFFDGSGSTTLYSPSANLYSKVATPATIDAALDDLAKRDITIAVSNFLRSDPYKSLTAALKTAYAVGTTDLFGQKVYHLAFTEPGAEWQMWLVGNDKPTVKRVEIIDKTLPHNPRISIDFLDWNFSPDISAATFTFNKPADAREIQMLKDVAEK